MNPLHPVDPFGLDARLQRDGDAVNDHDDSCQLALVERKSFIHVFTEMRNNMTRREAARVMAATGASFLVAPSLPAADQPSLLQRAIPSSGEMMPIIGLGTSGVFNATSPAE